MIKHPVLLISLTAALFSVSALGYCDNLHFSVQGIEIIRCIIDRIDEISTVIEQNDIGNVEQWAVEVRGLWKTFVEHNECMFIGEIEKSKSIGDAIQEVTKSLEQVFECSTDDVSKLQVLHTDLHNDLENLLVEISKPVLLAFLGPKCKSWPNCKTGKIMKERLSVIASKYEGVVRVTVIDITKEKSIAKSWKIMLVPTLVFIDQTGEEIYRRSGETDEFLIEDKLDGILE